GLACGFTLPALLEFNAACDDGRLATLARQLGAGTVEALREALQRLLEALGVKRLLGRYLASADDLIDRAPEMLTPGRADNNLRPAQAADVAAILAVSLGELGLMTFTVNRWGL
ncbi:MAG TPA: iron-containing alcohol dehydrogenase, partial [Roseiflexaceae bacterium]